MSALDRLELNIKEHKQNIQKGEALKRLMLTRDFLEIVMKGYLEQEAIRLVHLKSDIDFQSPNTQASIIRAIDSIGGFKQYLDNISQQHEQAIKDLEMDSQTITELINLENAQ